LVARDALNSAFGSIMMIELLGYLRANGFKTFIVSGGGTNSAA
jgi:phosphoserine phosphatase